MTNLLTRIGWEARVAAADRRAPVAPVALEEAARDVVDYLLFVDEAPLEGPVRGSSGFASAFSKLGPRDASGRSLRQLDLDRRLLRYPCSYMIYSEAFARLPDAAKEAVYQRLWRVLSGQERQAPYERLSAGDRRAVVEILNATIKGLPGYFRGTVQ
jgi:hypothetical protein